MQIKNDSFPFVEIVIPTKNSEKTLEKCLSSLSDQTYPEDKYRVIIIDDSTDKTKTVISSFQEFLNIKVLNAELGPSDKRNLGVNLSSGPYIAFIDSDCSADKNWLMKAVEYLQDKSVGAVGGPNLTPPDDGLMAKCSGHILASFFGTGILGQSRWTSKGKTRIAEKNELILCNVVVRKEVFQKAGGLDSSLYPGEEINLFSKFSEMGFKLLYSPEMVVYHKRRPLFRPHLKQIFGYGKGRGQAIRKREDAFNYAQLIPTIFSLVILASPVLLLVNGILHYLFFAAVFAYLIADILFSLQTAIRERYPILFLLLPISFFLHHFIYGLGWLFGLFWKRQKKELT